MASGFYGGEERNISSHVVFITVVKLSLAPEQSTPSPDIGPIKQQLKIVKTGSTASVDLLFLTSAGPCTQRGPSRHSHSRRTTRLTPLLGRSNSLLLPPLCSLTSHARNRPAA